MLHNSLRDFLEYNRTRIAPVSVDVPLISNQDVRMNIALIKQYHENMPQHEAEQVVFDSLQRLGLGHIAYKRNTALTAEERFCVMLLRAVMVEDAVVVIDRPFKLIPHLKDVDYIFQILEKVEDLYVSCHIYDYKWMAEKYGVLCQ
jgi:ABC-type lipoprotein export system ATPase subunit